MSEGVGRRIKELRERIGMTQTMLAAEAGIRQGHISKIESGQYKDMNLSTLQAIAKALGVSIAVLLEGYEAANDAPFEDELADFVARLRRLPEEKRKSIITFVEEWVPNRAMNDPATCREQLAV